MKMPTEYMITLWKMINRSVKLL